MPSTILRPYWLTIRNRYRFGARGAFGLNRDMLLLAVGLLIMTCIFIATYVGLGALVRNPVFIAVLPPRLLDVLYFYFFFLLLISNTVAATGNIYTSDKMSLLLLAPISKLRLFTAKFVETWIETGFMFFVLTFPSITALTLRLGLSPKFIILYLLLSIPYLAIPVGIGIILSTVLSRLVAFVWKRGAFFMSFALIAIVWGLWSLASRLQAIRHAGTAAQSLASFAGLYENPNPFYLPSRWVTDLLNMFLGTPVDSPFTVFATLFAAATAVFFAAYLVYDFFMLPVRSLAGIHSRIEDEAKHFRDGNTDITRSLVEKIVKLFPSDQQTAAIILKDITSLLRDRAQALQLLLFLGMATLYLTVFNFMAYSMNLELVAKQVWASVLATLNAIFCGFIFTTVLTRLVYPAVSLEGRAFWILQVTPIDILRLIRAKMWCWFPLTSVLLVSILSSGALVLDFSGDYLFFTVVYGISLAIGSTGLAIGLGARFASFDWEAPNQITVSAGTLVLLLLGVMHVLTMTVPVGAIHALLLIPAFRSILGLPVTFTLLSFFLFFIIFTNILIAKIAIEGGAKSLMKSRGQTF